MVESTQLGGGDSSVNYWQPRCVHQLVAFVLCWTGYVPWTSDTYWISTPFSCFPFISPPMHCHVPSHTHQALHFLTTIQQVQTDYACMNMHLIHQLCCKYPQIVHQSSKKSPNLYLYCVRALNLTDSIKHVAFWLGQNCAFNVHLRLKSTWKLAMG
jgi:hypothetical protein